MGLTILISEIAEDTLQFCKVQAGNWSTLLWQERFQLNQADLVTATNVTSENTYAGLYKSTYKYLLKVMEKKTG